MSTVLNIRCLGCEGIFPKTVRTLLELEMLLNDPTGICPQCNADLDEYYALAEADFFDELAHAEMREQAEALEDYILTFGNIAAQARVDPDMINVRVG